ncbi:MAG TPA: hypothetical protein PKY59_14810 [Pyrinomonadaceae bacterium]|nr:hypothetical protein [Pyrinomonadaceae bacterium]
MNNYIVNALIAWFIPGLGHILQGKIKRGIIIGASVWILIIVAIISGGAHYPGFEFKDGALLYVLNTFARIGNGLGALVSYYFMSNPMKDVAAWATFEYGGRLLEVAGLLNYLAVIDSVDIQLERKK